MAKLEAFFQLCFTDFAQNLYDIVLYLLLNIIFITKSYLYLIPNKFSTEDKQITYENTSI